MKIYLSFLVLISLTAHAQDKKTPLTLHFYNEEKIPLVIFDQDKNSGLYFEIISKTLKEAGIKVKLKRLNKLRARSDFAKGRTIISCCDNPLWRTTKQEVQIQSFSDPMVKVDDVLVYHEDNIFELKDLKDKRVVLVEGYSYKDEKTFKKKEYLKNELAILHYLRFKRGDIAIMNRLAAIYYIKKNNLPLVIGETFSKDDLHFRVNKDHPDLLNKINTAIKKLKNEKFYSQLLKKYSKY